MSRGKFLSLEEARESGDFKQFCKEHPEPAERERFLKLLSAMSQGVLEEEGTSQPRHAEGSSGTRTRQGT